ncbi:head GIN domain-containing protein [Mucilaginibacter myungsuensis]|uniref:DUF2807 domain-containing protein n=1 Tax=Mucilaginibacter myungsuensis TaxID=649104 RepID=A0A929KY70_9SPHI|nr:head GIN domain-containing protein [Mucilaginibacter myungsuensis]MBE9663342.1 DUF2807 domain-containing protein [Mucilaginibacter myungsuensis]MDN3600077.1 head GIN domain-containing protein [Mucilaginibacter myungsuensis]
MRTITKLFCAALLLASTIPAFAETDDRKLSGFHAVHVAASFDVYVTQGSTESVKVDAPADVLDKIVTEVKGDVLTVTTKDNKFDWGRWFNNGRKKITIYVAVKDIHAITISGSADVFFKDGLRGDNFDLKISGSGDVTGKLEVKTLNASISGSGDIKLTGSAGTSTVGINGSGDYDGRSLVTATTTVRISGSGDATVNASEKVDAKVSGSGDIRYTGGAKNVSAVTSGSGDVHKF